MSNHLSNGEIVDVLYPKGVDDNGRTKYQKAPFQLLYFQTQDGLRELFVMPNSMGADLDQAFAADIVDEKALMARDDFGWVSNHPFIMEESEMGSFDQHSGNWRGYHCFGLY